MDGDQGCMSFNCLQAFGSLISAKSSFTLTDSQYYPGESHVDVSCLPEWRSSLMVWLTSVGLCTQIAGLSYYWTGPDKRYNAIPDKSKRPSRKTSAFRLADGILPRRQRPLLKDSRNSTICMGRDIRSSFQKPAHPFTMTFLPHTTRTASTQRSTTCQT